jgi:hypothetical protein
MAEIDLVAQLDRSGKAFLSLIEALHKWPSVWRNSVGLWTWWPGV